MEPFVVKHYGDTPHPVIKGNGFDGLVVGDYREEAEEFVEFVNALAAEVRELRRDRELLVKLHAAWTYPHAGSIGALLDEVAERVEPGIFGDAAMAAERGEGEVK